jgi:hypothetical protein
MTAMTGRTKKSSLELSLLVPVRRGNVIVPMEEKVHQRLAAHTLSRRLREMHYPTSGKVQVG